MKSICLLSLLLLSVFNNSAQNLIAYYPFNGGLVDASGNGYNGTLYGGATANDTLVIGNNNLDYSVLPADVMNGLNDFTVSFMYKPTEIQNSGSYPGNDIITGSGDSDLHELKIFYVEQNGSFIVTIHSDDRFFPFTMVANQWYCVIVIRENDSVTVYIDGNNIGVETSVPTGPINIDSNALIVGQEQDCVGDCFEANQSMAGKLDELKFYDSAFTPQQVEPCNTQLFAPAFASSDTEICEKFCLNFFDQSNNNPIAWQWFFPGGAPSFSVNQNPANICYDMPGVYDVTLITTNANGNDTLTLSGFITVNATPPFPSISQIGYSLTSSVATSYQWQFNSIDIPGATAQSYDVIQTGYYTVLAGDSNGCRNSATVYVLIAGIDNIGMNGEIFIYPNPADDYATIDFAEGEKVIVTVLNKLGQVVISTKATHSSVILPTKNLPTGIYLLKVLRENQMPIAKGFLVMH